MKHFDRVNATSFEEASALLREAGGKADALAGGSDLLGIYKDDLMEEYPEKVINLKTIPEFAHICEQGDKIVIGAGTTLSKVADSDDVKEALPALAEAAYSVASPLIRNIGTIGGNICQNVRCWYYRYPESIGGRLNCKRKGGETCYAINGENCYHSIFGGMHLHGSSCSAGCPAGIDIPTYMEFLRVGKWDEAADTIMKYNPMPMITARICPHVCQDECNQCTYGDSVNIHGVERSLGDYILKNKDVYYKAPASETGKKIAVIGAGPGGLSAAYYLRKAGHTVDVFDRMDEAGGVLRYGIPHYRLSKKLLAEFIQALIDMGVSFKMKTEIGTDITTDCLMEQYDNLYFGTGAWKQPILGLEGENLTQFGLNFLVEVNTYLKKAIGNKVLVCGGGNVAMDVALTATRLGAKNVRLICLEQRYEMPAQDEEVKMAEEEGIEIFNGWGLGKIVKDKSGKVTGLEAKRCISVFDEHGRFSPVYDESDTRIFESDYIILATGQKVDLDFLGDKFVGQIKTEHGLIKADEESGQTDIEKVYAGGDAVTGPDIAIRAIAAGRNAAFDINMKAGVLGKASAPIQGNVYDACEHLHKFDVKGIEAEEANKLPEKSISERNLTDEDYKSFDVETALKEAARCMNCGCYAVNASDITPVLVMADAEIVTTERILSAKELFTSQIEASKVLHTGEIVKEIVVPKSSGITHYDKKRVRDAIDFAIVSLASDLKVSDGVIEEAKLVYGGVAPVPYRMVEVEKYLQGKKISKEVAERAAEMSIKDTFAMKKNEYKLFMMKDLMEIAILRAAKEA